MELITDASLDDFQQITSYDIRSFFVDYISFIDVHYSNISNYFTGTSNVIPSDSFNFLDNLIIERGKIVDVVILNAQSLDNYQYWTILENIEDIGHALETASNASKWLRAAVTKDGYKQQTVNLYMAEQGQGLEDIERVNIKSSDALNTWTDTALQNQLREEDYTLDGGYLIKAIYKNNSSIVLNSVIDNIDTPEKTYGLDINKKITFIDDDLAVLSYNDTMFQSAKILTDLKVGDDPSFPDRGVDVKNVLGGSLAAISYPTIFRQLATNFATDDSFKSFSIIDVKRNQDAIYLDFSIESKAGDVFSLSSNI